METRKRCPMCYAEFDTTTGPCPMCGHDGRQGAANRGTHSSSLIQNKASLRYGTTNEEFDLSEDPSAYETQDTLIQEPQWLTRAVANPSNVGAATAAQAPSSLIKTKEQSSKEKNGHAHPARRDAFTEEEVTAKVVRNTSLRKKLAREGKKPRFAEKSISSQQQTKNETSSELATAEGSVESGKTFDKHTILKRRLSHLADCLLFVILLGCAIAWFEAPMKGWLRVWLSAGIVTLGIQLCCVALTGCRLGPLLLGMRSWVRNTIARPQYFVATLLEVPLTALWGISPLFGVWVSDRGRSVVDVLFRNA